MLYTQNIYNDYLNRNIFKVFLLISFGILFFLVFSRSVQLFEKAAADLLDPYSAVLILALKIPDFLTFIIPLSFFLSLLINLNELYRSNNHLVYFSASKSNIYLLKSMVGQGFFVCSFLLLMALVVVPISNPLVETLKADQGIEHKLSLLSDNKIHQINENTQLIFKSRNLDDNSLNDVVFSSFNNNEALVIHSANMKNSSEGNLLLFNFYNGTVLVDSLHSQTNIKFQKYVSYLKNEDGFSLAPSFSKIFDNKSSLGFIDIQWNMSFILMFCNLFLFAFAFTQQLPRESSAQKLIFASLIFFIYLTALIAFRNSYNPESESFWYLALWPVHVMFSIIGLIAMLTNKISSISGIFQYSIGKIFVYALLAILTMWLIF